MNIVRTIFSVSFVLISLTVLSQTSSNKDNLKIEEAYNRAKIEYSAFEKKHGDFIQTDNVLMHYLTWGNSSDTPLIWSHGSLTHSYELANIAESLVEGGYYVIAIDYYGHGKTPIPDHEVSIYHSADDILVLMDSLKIGKAILGGFSRGGYIASAFYDSYPERVLALILEDGGSVAFNTYNHTMSNDSLQAKISHLALPKELDELYNSSYNTEFEAYNSLYDPVEGGTQFEILSVVKQKNNKWITYAGLLDFFQMRDSVQYSNVILKPNKASLYGASITMVQPKIIFRNLQVPMLILDPVSSNDPLPFEKENMELQKKFPNLVRRIQYDNTEHNIHYEHPQSFVQDLVEFLKEIKGLK
ncbi:alpha/beta fold hydrolase [Albibacterium bauzanense]|uniref:Pimeloyl-ACP methyl ester carboxylesterase n=1 Tax=Albibacterium bauzanense TaxID=653929 RepID=A0A4R1LUG6_9SPHI|nr:alpha/beta hydrolase [Albibacterium bauzanense]TCK80803.1 pimeloyl-ACP methyl ester carboxylesterase [Albibacterium bauzanense]